MAERLHCTVTEKTNKTRFGTLRQNPWGEFPHFCCISVHCGPSLIFQVLSRQIRLWVKYNRKTSPWHPKANAIQALQAYNYDITINNGPSRWPMLTQAMFTGIQCDICVHEWCRRAMNTGVYQVPVFTRPVDSRVQLYRRPWTQLCKITVLDTRIHESWSVNTGREYRVQAINYISPSVKMPANSLSSMKIYLE